jgi:hypothetical protein
MWKIKEKGRNFIIVPHSECTTIYSVTGNFVSAEIKGKTRYSSSDGSWDGKTGWFFETIFGKCCICKKTKKFDFLRYLGNNYSDDECICPECIIRMGDDFLTAYNSIKEEKYETDYN